MPIDVNFAERPTHTRTPNANAATFLDNKHKLRWPLTIKHRIQLHVHRSDGYVVDRPRRETNDTSAEFSANDTRIGHVALKV